MNKKVLLIGVSGYIGNSLAQRLLRNGYTVLGIDNGLRDKCVKKDMGSFSATQNPSFSKQKQAFPKLGKYKCERIDIAAEPEKLDKKIQKFRPDTIVNLAHIPSGPYSMIDQERANYTLMNNIIGTNNLLWSIRDHCPDCHYLTIGTTGEYDHYSNIDIEEGYFSIEHNGRQSEKMIYPRRPGSIYHTSKVANTYLIEYLTRTWGLRTTDIMQSVVFGIYTDETAHTGLFSRLDSDEAFGTVINRFMLQAVLDQPLSVYGEGEHQRGFLTLNDSVQALEIGVNNPPQKGETRVWNQLSFWESMNSLAEKVSVIKKDLVGKKAEINHVPTPRNEKTTDHYYYYNTETLKSLGYRPTHTLEEEVEYTMKHLLQNRDRLQKLENNLLPKIQF